MKRKVKGILNLSCLFRNFNLSIWQESVGKKRFVYFVFTSNQTNAPLIVGSYNVPDKPKGDFLV